MVSKPKKTVRPKKVGGFEVVMIVDPPSGWMYGFPRPYNPKKNESDEKWFARMGYPQRLIDRGMLAHLRWWEDTFDNPNEMG